MNYKESITLGAVLIIIMALGIVMMYAIVVVIGDDDPVEEDRYYEVEATVDGVEYSGEGVATYSTDNSNYPSYEFVLTAYDADGNVFECTFWLFFDDDHLPVTSIYKRVGDTELDGETVQIWYWTEDDGATKYTFYVTGDYCTVPLLTISGDGLSLTATIVSS